MPAPPLQVFDSPCRSVCRIDDRLGWCIGCRRTRAEIKAWPTATADEKRHILAQLPGRAAAGSEPPDGRVSQHSESVGRSSCQSDSDSR
jgi:predicted Fe-S protein YdhL (DUF1289 family)